MISAYIHRGHEHTFCDDAFTSRRPYSKAIIFVTFPNLFRLHLKVSSYMQVTVQLGNDEEIRKSQVEALEKMLKVFFSFWVQSLFSNSHTFLKIRIFL